MKYAIEIKPAAITHDVAFGNMKSRYDANSLYFTRDGLPFAPISGEYHFSRYPRSEWRRELLKMKAGGLTAVATYIFWNYHEYYEGEYNFSGDNDIHGFLQICREVGMPCILRLGPWAHGECVNGGFPDYVNALPGKRTDDPVYLGYVRRFWERLYAEVETDLDGETVFAIQLENEYNGPMSHIRTLKKMPIPSP